MKRRLFQLGLLILALGVYSLNSAAVLKLSPASTTNVAVSEIVGFALNNTRVVYIMSVTNTTDPNIYSVPVTGGNSINLTQLTPNKFITAAKLSPDGARVFYVVNGVSFSRFDLFSVPADGSGLPVQISSINVNNGAVKDFEISPDGKTVYYIADQTFANQIRLFTAAADQFGTSSEIVGLLPNAMSDFESIELTPDGSELVYKADPTIGRAEFLKVSVAGGAPVSLSGPGKSSGSQYNFVISPTGSRVAFTLDRENATTNDFYSVPITGNVPPLKLSGPLQQNNDVITTKTLFSPDSNRLLYISQEIFQGNTNGARNLFNVAADNPQDKRQVNPNFDNNSKQVLDMLWNGKGDRIVYVADQFQDSIFRLFSTSINGGPITSLNDAFIVNGIVTIGGERGPQLVPNGRALLFIANKENVSKQELYFVPVRGGRNIKVSDPILPPAGGLDHFAMSSDSRLVAYTSSQEAANRVELYITSIPLVRDATADFDGDFVNDILLKKGRSLRILTRNNPTNTFVFKDVLSLLPKKHKILAAKDLNDDNRPEIIVKKGKKPAFTFTVTTNLLLTNAGVALPSVDKRFKIRASGFMDTNTIVVTTRGKKMRIYYRGFNISTNTTNVVNTASNFIERVNPKGLKVVGFGSFNEEPSVILRKKKQFSAITLTTTSNNIAFGTISTNIGTLPKKHKAFAAAPYLEEINSDIDIVIRKGKTISLLDLLPNGSTNTQTAKVLLKQEKRYKIVAPR